MVTLDTTPNLVSPHWVHLKGSARTDGAMTRSATTRNANMDATQVRWLLTARVSATEE